ncbi:MAG: VENN motif pre-toxin domain-containing protein [Pantoea sp.]|uniref:VENN motif pre-toxin domain-containing protein n=1 Tax=uncultured Pantoea sp. TaxID=218084 RepID=UPI0025942295|nr:VENN motif pre-toxin domain-containing protein [uncultured Pantoea sp.]MBZ6395367.1 VENN motif pre-toxin domain-containing protein [Pantoea sp.]
MDVADLSRDAAGADPGLDKICDKDKEQRRMETAQLLAEIGSQAGDIARTQGEIAATRAATEKMKNISPDQKKDAEAQWRKANPGQEPTAADITGQVYQTLYNREMLAGGMGTVGPVQQGISAATAAIQGLAGGNIAQAVSGAAASYLAEQIHTLTTTKGPDGKEVVNVQANLIAHAVVGVVTLNASGNPALAGASGAAMGEYIAQQMYPGGKLEDLSEEQRQTISALGTLAAGLAGGEAGDSTGGAVAGAQAGKNAVENNWLHVNEKTELEIAKQKLRSNDPAEREQAQQKINDLREKDISRDKKVMDACGNGRAASPGCASARLEAYSAKNEYETGNYNNKVSDMYPDAYGQIVSLLNITSVDAQNQQQVKDAMVNYAMSQFGLDKAKAEQYVSTYDGMKIVAASMTPVIGSAAASKIEALAGKQRLSNSFEVSSLPDANGKNHITAVKGDAKIPVDKIELYMRGKASGDLDLLKKEYNSLKDLQISNQKEFAKTLGAREKLNKLNDQIHNVERSQEMARVLNNAGIQDNAKNNAMIMDNLLNSASGVTPSNRETSIVVSAPGGNVRIYATWKLLPDGSKRLATVKTGAFK